MKKPLILVTNDDSYKAKGIRSLISVVKELGEILVVSPEYPQSGKSHSVTMKDPLFMNTIEESEFYKEYTITGTPADCVKMACHQLSGRKPDLLVSGINHGANNSVNSLYSGTVAAAMEGCMNKIPSIAFSSLDYSSNANFEPFLSATKSICEQVLKNGLPKDVCLNVNFPIVNKLKGIKIARQANSFWKENFDHRTTPDGNDYYWLTGYFILEDEGNDADENILNDGYATVVPLKTDITAYESIQQLKKWEFYV